MKKTLEERFIENEKQRKKRIKRIKENPEYIEWLESYTEKYQCFTSDQFQFIKDKLDNDDKENTESLEALFIVIDEYAKNNYIPSNKDRFGYHYLIGYNSNVYKIGFICGQEAFFYCDKVSQKENAQIIDFNDILQNKITLNAKLINLKLMKLKVLVDELTLIMPEEVLDEEIKRMYKKRK